MKAEISAFGFLLQLFRSMQRIVEPELLDELPPDDPRAIRSRRDLRRVNVLMRNHTIMASALQIGANRYTPRQIVDLGAGDGDFFLRIARRLAQSWTGVCFTLLDRQNIVSPATLMEFEKLGWRAESVTADVRNWPQTASATSVEVVAANLFLHHFSNAQLAQLFRAVSLSARLFVAVEPHRAAWPLLCSRLLWTVGSNVVTQHDALVSVRAGFAGDEISALWPVGDEWILTEKSVGLFSHVFIAQRRC